MAITIAVAGKGGVGKTTFAGFAIQYLIEKKLIPVLAVDADANSNLNEVLGVEVDKTLGQLREIIERSDSVKDSPIPAGMTKAEYLDAMFNRCLTEDDDFDLLVMGRTQGKGCYCFVNGLLQKQVQKLTPNYRYVVVDNEAGMEHISRGILPKIDYLILVSDASRRGIQAAGRIKDLAKELSLRPRKTGLVINRAPGGELESGSREEIVKQDLVLMGVIGTNEGVYEYDCEGIPIVKLPKDSPVRQGVYKIMDELLS